MPDAVLPRLLELEYIIFHGDRLGNEMFEQLALLQFTTEAMPNIIVIAPLGNLLIIVVLD